MRTAAVCLPSACPPLDFRGFRRWTGFYLYADVSHLCEDSFAFAARILEDTGVAMTPGVDFDRVNGHRFIRLCYARAAEDVREAVERLESWLRRG
jgi:aspartate/methionine/tyrosine aminotransferase